MTVNAVSRCVLVPKNVDGKLYGTANLGACRVDVVGGVGITPFFSDGFESGDFSTTQNGVTWSGVGDADVTVQSGRGVDGTKSAQFRFVGTAPGGDAGAERRFDLGALYTELTIAFDLYIPDGTEAWGGAAYAHRADSPSNNKFFRLWPADYNDDTKVGASFWTTTDSGVISKTRSEWVQPQNTSIGEAGVARAAFINNSDRGAWIAVKIYCKAATSTANGTMRIYKNGALAIDNSNAVDNYRAALPEGWRYGYLLGAANSGFDATTYLQIDNVKFYAGEA